MSPDSLAAVEVFSVFDVTQIPRVTTQELKIYHKEKTDELGIIYLKKTLKMVKAITKIELINTELVHLMKFWVQFNKSVDDN